MELLEKYIEELTEDTTFDDFTMKDTQMKLPAIKHKWVGRLIRHKGSVNQLKSDKQKLVTELATKLKSSSPYKISDVSAEKACYKHEEVVKISNKIKEHELIIELLEKTERVLNSMTYDIKNLTEIMKLETL